jgi:hypothetical protein
MSLPTPYGTHPWWLVAVLATMITLVAWIAVGQAVLERRDGEDLSPGPHTTDTHTE